MVRDGSFTKRYVFVPICETNHWSLLILCNLGEDLNSKSKCPCIWHLDSLQKRGEKFESEARRFVSDLYKTWNPKESSDEQISRIPFRTPKVPQQNDGISCGFFVLYFIYRFILDSPDEFNIEHDYPGFMTKDWFSQSDFQTFCENLSSTSKDLYNKQTQSDKETQTRVSITKEQSRMEDLDDNKESESDGKSDACAGFPNQDACDSSPKALDAGDDMKEKIRLVIYTPESSQEANGALPPAECKIRKQMAKSQKQKVLRIKLKPVVERRLPRLLAPANSDATPSRVTRSCSGKLQKKNDSDFENPKEKILPSKRKKLDNDAEN